MKKHYGRWLSRFAILSAAVPVWIAVTLTYANHFHNAFQFDDFHTILNNTYIRSLANIPKFFADGTTSSILPANQTWRPLVTTSLAIDYRLGGGYNPFYFHLSTFFWLLTLLVLLALLFQSILQRIEPRPANYWIAWFAAAWFGLHPAIAETVNYIIQRADLMSTLGLVAGLLLYTRFPAWRHRGLYLLPVTAGLLSKAPALIFPAMLAAYIFLIEEQADRHAWRRVARRCLPALVLSIVFIVLQWALTPRAYSPGSVSAYRYGITQPYVWFRCFVSFFLPLHLSADSDLQPLATVFSLEAVGGFLFVAALTTAIYLTARRRSGLPVAFGLTWFVLGLIPASVFPLAETENDHRMFLPFVGMVLAASWTGAWLVSHRPAMRDVRLASLAGAACLLLICAAGTHRRNQVWHTPESLWEDVTLKSPRNGRGLMNYGLARMSAGDFAAALGYFEGALRYTPNYPTLEVNLGIDCAAMGRQAEAERHFQRAIQLAPAQPDGHFIFGRWLRDQGRRDQAISEFRAAIVLSPARMDARLLLLQSYADQRDFAALTPLAVDTLKLAPDDPAARRFAEMRPGPVRATASAGLSVSPEALIELSLQAYQKKDYAACITFAQAALQMRSGYAEAYNNITAANNALGRWDDAIQAGREAVRLKPDFQLARNNLQWAEWQKTHAAAERKR